jgi:hypothetical protein
MRMSVTHGAGGWQAATSEKGQPRWKSTDDLTRDHTAAPARRGLCAPRPRIKNAHIPEGHALHGLSTPDVAKEDAKLFYHFLKNRDRIVAEAAVEVRLGPSHAHAPRLHACARLYTRVWTAKQKVPDGVLADLLVVLDKLGPQHALPKVRPCASPLSSAATDTGALPHFRRHESLSLCVCIAAL